MIRAGVALLVLALAACGTTPATYRDLDRLGRDYEDEGASPLASDQAAANRDTCGAYIYRPRIGTMLASWEPPEGSRVIRPEQPVTGDLRPDRLNILVDADGRITALECY